MVCGCLDRIGPIYPGKYGEMLLPDLVSPASVHIELARTIPPTAQPVRLSQYAGACLKRVSVILTPCQLRPASRQHDCQLNSTRQPGEPGFLSLL